MAGTSSDSHMTPSRYRVVEQQGRELIVCLDSPDIHLRVERGLSVDESRRGDFPGQTIFLDGVFSGPPFYDNKLRHYSLDHHEGCVRAFTLSTAEQAAVVLLQGLPLGKGSWLLCINSTDLDALLAAWILMNHRELLAEGHGILRKAMPLIRLEGVIDAHGLGWEILTAFPDDKQNLLMGNLEGLLSRERDLKSRGEWSSCDATAYSRDMLDDLDGMLLASSEIDELMDVEEVMRVALGGDSVGVLCRSRLGIYEVERILKKLLEENLGIVVLETEPGRYSMRLSDPFLSEDLGPLYKALNDADPLVDGAQSSGNTWGGASDIGGSPRSTGTGLQAKQIMDIVERVIAAPDE